MSGKLQVGLLYGGRSGEHEVSVRSARSVAAALDRGRFDLVPIGLDRSGGWHCMPGGALPDAVAVAAGQGAAVVPVGDSGACRLVGDAGETVQRIDVVFPVLHGPFGEDGTIQGLFEVLGVPYVGAGVLGSAVAMDKDIQKRLMRDAGVPIVPFVTLRSDEWRDDPQAARRRIGELGDRVFVKPANLGSSVGISKVDAPAQLDAALDTAFRYDSKAVVEKAVDAREIECAVLGNRDPKASLPGEIEPGEEFYSYDDKYSAESTARLLIPAPLTAAETAEIQQLAVRCFEILDLRGMARVDFFLERGSGRLYLNEPNTIPGFTSISMYPKLWEASGVPYPELVSRLIELALEWHQARPVAVD